jgi:ATP-binding cassette subfamily A (ABC1) protein 3
MYILPINRLIQRIVNERETKAREIMKIMGLTDLSYWFSWFIYYFSISTVISLLTTIILCTKVFPNSNWFLIFVLFWIYGISLFGYAVFVFGIFSRSRVAAINGSVFFFFSSFLD